MLTRDGYAALTHIYDAAANLGRWRAALDGVARTVEARAIALLIRRPDAAARDLHMLNSTYLDFTRSPWGIYYGLRLSRLQNPDWDCLSRQPARQPTLDTATGLTADELDRRADYAFLRKRLGIGRRIGFRLNADRMWFDAISLAYDANLTAVPKGSVEATSLLLPHLTKAVELGRTFSVLKSRYAAVLTALDRVRVGLAIALPSGEIIVENDETRRILDKKDGLTKGRDGHLKCQVSEQTAALGAAIEAACGTAAGEADLPETLLTVARPSGGDPLLVDVAPLKDSNAELEAQLAGALITIIDPDRVPHLRMDRFVALYDLTPAEAEVCGLILQGLAVDEIAERRNTTPVTAKNQIAAILFKTGVNRRSQLIRLVIRVLPPVD